MIKCWFSEQSEQKEDVCFPKSVFLKRKLGSKASDIGSFHQKLDNYGQHLYFTVIFNTSAGNDVKRRSQAEREREYSER